LVIRAIHVLIVVLGLAGIASGQQLTGVTVPIEPAPLTEVELLKLENARLLLQLEQLTQALVQVQLKQQTETNQQIISKILNDIEAVRPGFAYDPATGQFVPKVSAIEPKLGIPPEEK